MKSFIKGINMWQDPMTSKYEYKNLVCFCWVAVHVYNIGNLSQGICKVPENADGKRTKNLRHNVDLQGSNRN